MAQERKRIGILTSGGDTPGMNAAIRSIVMCGRAVGMKVMGIQKGYEGLMSGRVIELREGDVDGIVTWGRTILKTARSKEFATKEGLARAVEVIHAFDIDGLVVIGLSLIHI